MKMIEAAVVIVCMCLCALAVSQTFFQARTAHKKADSELASREVLTGMHAQFQRAVKEGVFREPGRTAHWKTRMEAVFPVSSIVWDNAAQMLGFECEGILWTIAASEDGGSGDE